MKLSFKTSWNSNKHARLLSILKLTVFHAQYLKKTQNDNESKEFLANFLSRTVNHSSFYRLIKDNFAYPGIIFTFTKLQKLIDFRNYPILLRDLEAMKKLFSQAFNKD